MIVEVSSVERAIDQGRPTVLLFMATGCSSCAAQASAVVAAGARVVVTTVPWVSVVLGILLVLLGAWLLGGRHLAVSLPAIVPGRRSGGYGALFAFGVAYGRPWCRIGPPDQPRTAAR